MRGGTIRITKSKIKNPCYDENTGKDCELRKVGCRLKCNRYKIYETLKNVEARRKDETIKNLDLIFSEEKSKTRRLDRISGVKRYKK